MQTRHGRQRTHASTSTTSHLLQPNPPTRPRDNTCYTIRKGCWNLSLPPKIDHNFRQHFLTGLFHGSFAGLLRVSTGLHGSSTGLHGFSTSPCKPEPPFCKIQTAGLDSRSSLIRVAGQATPHPFLRSFFLAASSFLSLWVAGCCEVGPF